MHNVPNLDTEGRDLVECVRRIVRHFLWYGNEGAMSDAGPNGGGCSARSGHTHHIPLCIGQVLSAKSVDGERRVARKYGADSALQL